MSHPETHWPEWPLLRPLGSGEQFVLEADYVYELWLRVPAGFVHDMASVPKVLWALISPFDLGPAALVHDYGYSVRGRFSPSTRPWTRASVDSLFNNMMKASGVAWWRRRTAYLAVRAFGARRWKK